MKNKNECPFCKFPPHNERESMQLMHLRHCNKSTNMGLVDQGFPGYMREMTYRKWVKPVGKGHQITEEGKAYLKLHENWFRSN